MKSSPPKWLSPATAFTSATPSKKSKIDTSKVPPPKSNIKNWFSSFDSYNPYAKAAAVGSLINLSTFNPANSPAIFVALLWKSLKYAGTLITASVPLHLEKLLHLPLNFLL